MRREIRLCIFCKLSALARKLEVGGQSLEKRFVALEKIYGAITIENYHWSARAIEVKKDCKKTRSFKGYHFETKA